MLRKEEYVGVTEQRTVLKDATTKDVPIMLFEEEYVLGMAPLNTEQSDNNMHNPMRRNAKAVVRNQKNSLHQVNGRRGLNSLAYLVSQKHLRIG